MPHSPLSPQNHLAGAGKIYPDIWRKIDAIRESAGWPAWCFAPISEIYKCVRAEWAGRADLHNMATDIARLAGLSAWRATQGIYQFDPDLYSALITTPVDRLPAEVLTLLPEWGIYVETPDRDNIAGFFAHCDYDPRTKSPELRLLLNVPDNLIPLAVPIIDGALSDAINQIVPGAGNNLAETCGPLISLVLYICSVSADFGHYSAYRPAPVKTKRGYRLFPPDAPTVIKTGGEIGSILRASRATWQRQILAGPTGRVIQPHVRRAHWHGYWLGNPIKFQIRWMPPVLVKGDTPACYNRRVM